MLRILYDPGLPVDIEAHARSLHYEMMKKHKYPLIPGITRALIPTWCSTCDERCWGTDNGFAVCSKCRGEGKLPIGFTS